jgi:hypothetical protein
MADANTALVTLACVQGVINAVLLGTTVYYARKTKDIASATKEQADATREQAQAQREQLAEAKAARSQQIRPVVRVDRVNGSLKGQPRVTIRNVGRGDATNGTATIEWRGGRFKEHSGWSLTAEPGKDTAFTFEKEEGQEQETPDSRPRVVIECDDNDGVRWRSGRNLRVDDDTGACDMAEEFGPEEVKT